MQDAKRVEQNGERAHVNGWSDFEWMVWTGVYDREAQPRAERQEDSDEIDERRAELRASSGV